MLQYCLLLIYLVSFFSIAMATKENMTSQRGMLKSIHSRVNTLASILYTPHGSPCGGRNTAFLLLFNNLFFVCCFNRKVELIKCIERHYALVVRWVFIWYFLWRFDSQIVSQLSTVSSSESICEREGTPSSSALWSASAPFSSCSMLSINLPGQTISNKAGLLCSS